MSDNIKKPTVMALGYFDSVHEGHKKVIKTAIEFADKNGFNIIDEKMTFCEKQLGIKEW